MSSQNFTIQRSSSVVRVTLDREQRRNALTRDMLVALTAQFSKLAEDPTVRLIEVASTGTVFCAGMDLGEMQQRAGQAGADDWLKDSVVYRDLLLSIIKAPQPVLAIVQGPVLAGGVGLVLACDMVLAEASVFFALPEPQRGIAASMVIPLLLRRVGLGHANHLLLAGQRVSASELVTWGICQQVVEADQFAGLVGDWQKRILSGSPQALAATKAQVNLCGGDIESMLEQAAVRSAEARGTSDAKEGLAAFLEKRSPSWSLPQGS